MSPVMERVERRLAGGNNGWTSGVVPDAGGPLTILVVDDEADIAEAVAAVIHADHPDLEVVTAASGAEGLECLRQRAVALIITDFRMPAMDGLEFLEMARIIAPGTSRMMMTAFPDIDLATTALNQERISHFLLKPLKRKTIKAAVTEALGVRKQEQHRVRDLVAALHAMQDRRIRKRAGPEA